MVIASDQEQNERQKGRSAIDAFMEEEIKGNIVITLEILKLESTV